MMRHVAANVLSLLIVGLVLLFGLIVWGQSQFKAAGPLEAPLRFQVERGEGLGSVADKLSESGAIIQYVLEKFDGLRFGHFKLGD